MYWSKVTVRRGVTAAPDGHLLPPDVGLAASLEQLRRELGIVEAFPPEVLAEAERTAGSPDLPDTDWRDLELVTIDPPGATDLDQALHLERRGTGYRLRYAIADVPAFVPPGSAFDLEARRRGQTMYAPDRRVPLHPEVVSEDAASLLPGKDRPALVWVLDLDAGGRTMDVDLVRAVVRSRAQLTYEQVQADLDAGRAPSGVDLLAEVGRLRAGLERERGGATLAIPDQEVVCGPDGCRLRFRPPLPVEDWNAQVSLMTGMAAAEIMLDGGIGLLRTMPAPDERTLARFRRQGRALGVTWPEETPFGEMLNSLDPQDPRQLALLHESVVLFRGAGYTPFDGAPPEQRGQAAVAAPYAHVTAPLRRLVDRFTLTVCHALLTGAPVPDWARAALPELPARMAESDRVANALDRGAVDAAEAAVLAGRVGETFEAVVVDVDSRGGGEIQLADPPVLARCDGDLELGAEVTVRLDSADVAARTVRFSL
ncbi:RNB domain-containing ribonuclease [Quadrisphaera sp. GCM10027208]|uniref:RNB domain-containing ribonuclease n=1 Tax=Quadrisphaera sp. GCM10027208 TaxID=3273423 RepID=UPI0036206ACE